jgi:hypothetical protein
LTRPWLLLVAACAIVVLAVALAVSSAQRPPSPGRAAALTSTDPADGAALVRAPSGVELSFTAAPDPDLSHVSVRDGRELAGTLNCSVGTRLAAGAGAEREPSTVDAATDADAAAKADAAGSAEVAAGSAHQHGVDPVSATLLAVDGVVALAVVVLLLRRPPPPPSRPPS